jgi:hypothetical protein
MRSKSVIPQQALEIQIYLQLSMLIQKTFYDKTISSLTEENLLYDFFDENGQIKLPQLEIFIIL